jgi:CubicO group peptidase (beta-lactamase class C family)
MNDLPAYFENWDAAGAMYSTPSDLARFAEALFGGRLVKPASLAKMLTPGLDDYGYGLWSYDFKRNGRTYRVAKRPGSIMGANTVLYRLIDQKVTIVILANSNEVDLDEFAQRIAEHIVDQSPSISS